MLIELVECDIKEEKHIVIMNILQMFSSSFIVDNKRVEKSPRAESWERNLDARTMSSFKKKEKLTGLSKHTSQTD